eukprot:COSAG02_NODE_26_length_51927_cov_61.213881_40_plen_154_part_00
MRHWQTNCCSPLGQRWQRSGTPSDHHCPWRRSRATSSNTVVHTRCGDAAATWPPQTLHLQQLERLRWNAQRHSLIQTLSRVVTSTNAMPAVAIHLQSSNVDTRSQTHLEQNRPPGQRWQRSRTPSDHHCPAHRPVLHQTFRCLLLASATLSTH